MSWTPTDEQVEMVARYGHSFDQQVALQFGHQTELIPFESLPQWAQDTHREKARAQLVAVGPHIAASAWSDGMEAGHDCTGTDPRSECFDKNPYREKEAGR
jgi:hypothetical protein